MEIAFIPFLAPLIASLILALPWKLSEKIISYITLASLVTALWGAIFQLDIFITNDLRPFEVVITSLKVADHDFIISSWIDMYGLGYLIVSLILGLIVTKFSHSYLHLEKGYQRYFSTILFFLFGLTVLSIAGHLDTFFAGWEIVGFSSFLLISFYRNHTRSVNNACRIYNIYRICDIGLLSGAVLGHILWKEAATFSVLNEVSVSLVQETQSFNLIILSLCLIFASLGKSAQFPFYNWPARAMEGPTPSSAIFYGALSIHAGILLLIRTEVIWSNLGGMQILIGLIGLITFVLSRVQKNVQSNIKGKIAYKITSHLGLMFILLSFKQFEVTFVYMILHAIYRCVEILISPSIVASSDSTIKIRKTVPATLFLLSSMDFSFYRFVFIRRFINRIVSMRIIGIVVFVSGLFVFIAKPEDYSLILGGVGMFYSFRALLHQKMAFKISLDIFLSVMFLILSFVQAHFEGGHLASTYLYPILPSLIIVMSMCYLFRKKDLTHHHGLGTRYTWQANIFMLGFMIIAGMPISSAFIAEDVLLEFLIPFDPGLTLMCLFIFMLNGVTLAKIYTRLFMGRVGG